MLKTAIAIPAGKLNEALKSLQGMPDIPSLACDASDFEDEQTANLLAENGIRCPLLMNLTPDDTIAALETAEATHATSLFYKNIFSIMTLAAAQNGADAFSLPLRLDRIPENVWQNEMSRIVSSLEDFLDAPMPNHFSCLLPVRFPKTFPGSEELARSLALCKAVNQAYHTKHAYSSIQASLDILAIIYPDEEMPKGHRVTPDTFRENDLLSSVKALMFNFQPAAGETLFDDEQMEWAAFLKESSFDGTVIFNPVGCSAHEMPAIYGDIAEWMKYYL